MSSNSTNSTSGTRNAMTKDDASRIQSTQAKGGNNVGSNSFASRAQSAGDRNANASGGGNKK
ncbi:hypothetical protein EIP91_003345 [Steccherinum ochraceum]|uniref:SMP domain-containing protein n=1 Tax=Steccherinum ochraceum TaxID=92696 RepID=A0A4R0RRF4_9APHY|nr:hypothetical protein EIP91_003345 [Steccherinum ochraceum]